MSWYNIFSKCFSTYSFKEFLDESSEEQERSDEKDEKEEKQENIIVLVKFKKDCIEFLVSEDGEIFSFVPSKSFEEIKFTWFDEDKPKHILFKRLSKLSENRKVFHKESYFENRIKKVYFRYENKQIVPYRYAVKK